MKKLVVAFLFMCVSMFALAGEDYSIGYRMGMLTKYSISGLINKSGEGEINLGREGTPLFTTDKDGNRSYTNPWQFSSKDYSKFNDKYMNQYAAEYVIVKYRQDFFNLGISQKTGYNITDISRVDTSLAPMACIDDNVPKGAKSDGFRVGRMVKASTKGLMAKSYEVMIQQGNAGNQYFPMSVLSSKMFDCAVHNMRTAKPIKVYYTKSWIRDFTSQDSNYSIWKMEPVGDI